MNHTLHTAECENHVLYTEYECSNDVFTFQKWALARPRLPYITIVIYLLSIYAGQSIMKNRKPLHLKWPLFVWNAALSLLAFIGVIRGTFEVGTFVSRAGFLNSMCIAKTDNVTAFWVFVFLMSKFAELGDTFFLVAKKKHVMFLHWYHHVTVLLFTWHAFVTNSATGRYFIFMNVIVHLFMYTYYALHAIGIHPPTRVSMLITTLQILQMAGGIYILSRARSEHMAGNYCEVPKSVIDSGFLMYSSYLALFVQFFLRAYVLGERKNLGIRLKGDMDASCTSCKQQRECSESQFQCRFRQFRKDWCKTNEPHAMSYLRLQLMQMCA